MKIAKYLLIAFFLVSITVVSISDRVLKIGIVNADENLLVSEVYLDGVFLETLYLEQSIIPLELIEIELPFGIHTVEIVSQDCKSVEKFEFLNVMGYKLSVEYRGDENEECNVLRRESYFELIYM